MRTLIKKIDSFYKVNPDVINLTGVFFCVVIIYWPVYHFRFVHDWDDRWAILNYYTEDGFSWSNLYAIVSTFYGGQYAPVNQFYYTTMYFFFGYDPMYYHIGSVIIHMINIVLVYFLFKVLAFKLFNNALVTARPVAIITTFLFAISPFNIEPVVWVSAAKVIFYALFYLLSLHCYCKYLDAKKPFYYYLTLFFFILSFGAKEQAVTLPLCMLLFDFAYNRSLTAKLVWFEKLPFFITSFLFGYISVQSQGKELFEATDFYPFYQRVILSFYTISEYFTKTIFPVNLSYLYPFPFQVGDAIPLYLWIYPAGIVAFTLAYYREWQKNKWLIFGTLFFVIHLLLVINLLSLARFSVVADRYAYVSTIGLYFIMAVLFVKGLARQRIKKWVVGIGVIYIFYFVAYAHNYTYTWTNSLTLKSHLKKAIRSRSDFEQWKIRNIDK